MKELQGSSTAKANDFDRRIKAYFGVDTVVKVHEAFQKLELPLPKERTEFMEATDGALLFLDKYGVVLRIESTDNRNRVNPNPWMLQPLATVQLGSAVMEICPGCHVGKDRNDRIFLGRQLERYGVDYWDDQVCNGGRLPIKMPSFPQGVPIVIDRLAARKLEGAMMWKLQIKHLWEWRKAAEAKKAQKQLYGSLRRAFKKCWAGGRDMKAFWGGCASHKQQGKLISGWADLPDEEYGKTTRAKKSGAEYALRLQPGGRG